MAYLLTHCNLALTVFFEMTDTGAFSSKVGSITDVLEILWKWERTLSKFYVEPIKARMFLKVLNRSSTSYVFFRIFFLTKCVCC